MSNPFDCVLGTPPTNTPARQEGLAESTCALETGLAIQQREREKALHELARLRKEASAEIDRLIGFIDETDEYVTGGLEENGDELDASYPEGISRSGSHPNEDDEDGADDEPSLGSSGHFSGGPISYMVPVVIADGERMHDCEGDEHDGREPENEGGEAVKEDDEPSLGWTDAEASRGQYAGSRGSFFDLEEGERATPPQNRTVIDREPLTVEVSYTRLLRGLTATQREAMKNRQPDGSGVSLVGGPEWGD